MPALRTAWRNLLRSPKRTAITLSALTLTTAILIVSYALMVGIIEDLERSVTGLLVGEAQVHAPGYLAERSIYDTLGDAEGIVGAAREAGIDAAKRAFGYGLLSSGTKSAGAQFWGISPAEERALGDLPGAIARGSFLPEGPGNRVVLGRKLAKTLAVEPGDELVVVVQAADGSLGNELFYVAGVLKGLGETYDRSLALVHRRDFAELFVFAGRYHEVALSSHGALAPEQVAAAVREAAPGQDVRTWLELLPPVAEMLRATYAAIVLFGLIFFLAGGLGVLNTMLMATYERIPEFGLVKALGATPLRIVGEVAAEGLVLGLASTVLGGVLGVGASLYLDAHPIDLSRFAESLSAGGVAFSPLWRAHLSPECVWGPIVAMWAVSALAALYPAVKAARLDPVRAMTHV